MIADAIRLLLFPAMMAFAASSDLLTMTISNRVSLILVGSFFVLAAIGRACRSPRSARMSAPSLLVLVVTFMFFARGWIGGGDAKLAAATALWLGFDQLLNYLIIASLFGGVLTLLIMRFRLMPLPRRARRSGMGQAPAPHGCRRALRHRARARGARESIPIRRG